jgi:hypothetical protein
MVHGLWSMDHGLWTLKTNIMSLSFPPKVILKAKHFFNENPDGSVRFINGFEYIWNKEEFYAWFTKCLLLKCGGEKLTERQFNKIKDGRIINEYYGKRIRRSGRNILSDPKLQRQYPHINHHMVDYD